MIPVTAEMVQEIYSRIDFWNHSDDGIREGLEVILAGIERDHLRLAPGPDRCSACGRTARNLTPVTELVDGQPTVVQRLGPSCHARYLRAGSGRQALPLTSNALEP